MSRINNKASVQKMQMGEIFLTKIQDERTKDSYTVKSSSFDSAQDEKLCELT